VAKIPEFFNFGNDDEMNIEDLVIKLQRMYSDLAIAINAKPDLVQRTTDGQVGDTFLPQGTININTATNKVEMITNHPTQTTVTWTLLG
jgi:hypothetical protein